MGLHKIFSRQRYWYFEIKLLVSLFFKTEVTYIIDLILSLKQFITLGTLKGEMLSVYSILLLYFYWL